MNASYATALLIGTILTLAAWLIIHGHPWAGGLFVGIVFCVRAKSV